jgi:hypothetical protein
LGLSQCNTDGKVKEVYDEMKMASQTNGSCTPKAKKDRKVSSKKLSRFASSQIPKEAVDDDDDDKETPP